MMRGIVPLALAGALTVASVVTLAPSGHGPMKVPAEQLRRLLGVREVRYTAGAAPLAVVERALA